MGVTFRSAFTRRPITRKSRSGFYLFPKIGDHAPEQFSAPWKRGNYDVLVRRVPVVADRAQAVQRWDAHCRRKIPVAAAPARRFDQIDILLTGDGFGQSEQFQSNRRSLKARLFNLSTRGD